MANCCSTDYVFYSENKDSLSRFHDFLSEMMEKCRNGKVTFVSNGKKYKAPYPNYWNMQEALGVPENARVSGRGDVLDVGDLPAFRPSNGDSYELPPWFSIGVEDAWVEHPECFDKILESFPDVEYAFKSEEAGCEIFHVHDDKGFFDGKFLLDASIDICNDSEGCYEYYETEEDAVSRVKKLFENLGVKVEINSAEDIDEEVNRLLCQNPGWDITIGLHEFEEV